MKQVPHAMPNGSTTRSPTETWVTSAPTSSTTPIGSWPSTSPSSMKAPSTSYRCRSDPQMPLDVMRTITSVGSWMAGSGTVSTRTSRFPCQVSAFMSNPRSSVSRLAYPDARRTNAGMHVWPAGAQGTIERRLSRSTNRGMSRARVTSELRFAERRLVCPGAASPPVALGTVPRLRFASEAAGRRRP